jgi:hypothetical protein
VDAVGEEGAVGGLAEDAKESGRLSRRGRKEHPRELRRGRVLGRDGAPVGADGAEQGAVEETGKVREDAGGEVQAEVRPRGNGRWAERGLLLCFSENAAVVDGGRIGDAKGEKTT